MASDFIPAPYFDGGEVLVVDDNELIRRIIREQLQNVRLHTTVVEHGLAALNAVRSRRDSGRPPFGLIFMDIHMPVMDGLQASAEIAKLETGSPIVAMTADTRTFAEKPYTTFGMCGMISKPFVPQEIWRVLSLYFNPSSGCCVA